jgi:hypothetical protein
MVIKKIQLLATKFGKKGSCNMFLESSCQALQMAIECNQKFGCKW